MSKQSMPGDKTGYKRGTGPYSNSPPKVTSMTYDSERSRSWGKDRDDIEDGKSGKG